MATQTLDKIVWERRLQILETSLGADIMHYMHQDDVTACIRASYAPIQKEEMI